MVLPIVGAPLLRNIVKHFPSFEDSFIFAYGSAVYPQQGQGKGKMIDIIFVVPDPLKWHAQNLEINGSHYSFLRRFGAKVITAIQERMASGVYYNPFVTIEGQLLKYGVISNFSLESDCRRWNRLYVAGRLHKPVLEIQPSSSSSLLAAMKMNRESALRAVLLQEGRFLSKYSLYHGIAELSYLGDSRVRLGAENPEKAKNIVSPLMGEFDEVYSPMIRELHPYVAMSDSSGMLVQDTTPQCRFRHLMSLPDQVQVSLVRQVFRDPSLVDIEEVMAELSYVPYLRSYIRNAVADVVWGSSIRQTLQGVLTSGVTRSVKYAWEKIQKGRQQRSDKKEVPTTGK